MFWGISVQGSAQGSFWSSVECYGRIRVKPNWRSIVDDGKSGKMGASPFRWAVTR